jgi:hypothetical protein
LSRRLIGTINLESKPIEDVLKKGSSPKELE